MPPRYAYWTIIVDDQPTAFRAGALDDIMPTFNRLKEKQPTAKLMWFQSGKLWPSRIDAREAMQVRGERGRYSDPRQDGGNNASSRERPKWQSKDFSSPPSFAKASDGKRAPKPSTGPPARQPRWGGSPQRSGKLEWKPRGSSSPQDPAKRKWIPKAEYKKLTGTEARRDDKWRPGGEHKDPRQKYIDAKKAKWGRFKQAIRSRAKKKS